MSDPKDPKDPKDPDEPEFDFSDETPHDEGESIRDMVRNTDPDTAWEAAEKAFKSKTKSMRECKAIVIEMLSEGYLNGNLDFSQKEFGTYCIEVKGMTRSRTESLRRRFTDLQRRGDYQLTGAKRDGAQLYRLNAHMSD